MAVIHDLLTGHDYIHREVDGTADGIRSRITSTEPRPFCNGVAAHPSAGRAHLIGAGPPPATLATSNEDTLST